VERITGGYFKGNIRYPAGLLGWDHPEIRRRLVELRRIVDDEPRQRRELVTELAPRAKAPAGGTSLGRERRALRFVDVACRPDACVMRLAVGAALARELCAKGHAGHLALAGVDPAGAFLPVALERRAAEGDAWSACGEDAPAGERGATLRATVPGAARL